MTAHEEMKRRFMLWEELCLHKGYDALPVVCIGMTRRGEIFMLVPADNTEQREIGEQLVIAAALDIAQGKT